MSLHVKAIAIAVTVAASGLFASTAGVASASGTGGGVVVLRMHVKGYSVWGWHDTTEIVDGCEITSHVNLLGGKNEIAYTEYQFNWCTGDSTEVYGTATPTVFKPTGNLDRIQVVVDIPLRDWLGPTGKSVSVNDTWTATSAPVRSHTNLLFRTPPGYISHYIATAIQRDAEVSGSFPLGAGVVYRESVADLSITRQPSG